MKHLLKQYAIDTFALYVVSQLASGMVFTSIPKSLLLAGLGLALSSIVVKPIINILMIPLNLITFGLFKWVSSAIALYIVTLVVPGFKIVSFNYLGLTTRWLDIPSFSLSPILAFLAFSFLLSFITSALRWLLK